MEPIVQTRVEEVANFDVEPSSEEQIGNFKKIRYSIQGIKDPISVLTLYEKHVKQALTSNEGKKWTLALKIGIFREYPTIIGDN